MDERVRKALAQWPDVPDAYGWLSLTRHGDYLLRGEAITHPKLIAFIQRNYGPGDDGGYVFQNGPQRVHVTLATTPYIARLEEGAQGLRLRWHTGTEPEQVDRALLDPDGQLVFDAKPGPAMLDDRDMAMLGNALVRANGEPADETDLQALLDASDAPALAIQLADRTIPLEPATDSDHASRFGFRRETQAPK